ncbi:MAG TPA: TetR/AcrR family transcriptional regulator [Nitrospirae bacterium]|nr:TetR/AcrR family transcriptional regulator [Nitrospirota bacterium]
MAPKIVDKEEKRKEILSAAMRVFARKGFSASRVIDVAREAGIGKGTVYEYFHSKDEIFLALYEEMKAEFHQRIFVTDKDLPPQERLKRFITSALSAFEEWKDLSHILLDFWAEHRGGGSVDFRFDELYKDARARLAGLIREGIRKGVFRKVNPVHTASLLIAIVDGLLLQWVFNPKSFSLTRIGRDSTDIILKGIEKKKH